MEMCISDLLHFLEICRILDVTRAMRNEAKRLSICTRHPSHRVTLAETWLTVYRQHSVISRSGGYMPRLRAGKKSQSLSRLRMFSGACSSFLDVGFCYPPVGCRLSIPASPASADNFWANRDLHRRRPSDQNRIILSVFQKSR